MNISNPIYNSEIFGSTSEGGTLTIAGSNVANGGNVCINPDGGKTGLGTSNPSNNLSVNGNADFSGNVGIGTTTPLNALSVNGNTDITGSLSLTGSANIAGVLTVNNNASFTTKLGIGTTTPASTLDVQGDLSVSDNIYFKKWKVTQLFQSHQGPLPINSTFTTGGGTLLIFISGSGWSSSGGQIGLSVLVDGTTRGYSKSYTNEKTSHKAFVPTQIVVGGLTAGSHTLELSSWNGTLTDLNDFYTVTITELPW